MKLVILAGGHGSDIRPKPLVTIGGMSIIWHIMDIYAAHGIRELIVCAGYILIRESEMPFAEGRSLKGWGVVKIRPWHFAGLFESREAADAKAEEMGSGYEVHYGELQAGTDNFVWID